MAFNAKNLHYEKQEPAFLRKLRGENASDRSNVQFARPNKPRLKTGDDDDGPTIVDESGENVSREEYEALTKRAEDGEGEGEEGEGVVEVEVGREGGEGGKGEGEQRVDEKERERQKVAEVGAPKKRKAVRVVGGDVEDTDVVAVQKKEGGKGVKKYLSGEAPAVRAGTSKKKSKKIKLSFEEPEG